MAINIAIALLVLVIVLACCDVFVILFLRRYQQQKQQPPEAESLLHPNQQTRSRFKEWLYRYNHLLRLVVTEIVAYLIILASTIAYYSGHSTKFLNILMLGCSAATFGILVYVSQLAFFARFTETLHVEAFEATIYYKAKSYVATLPLFAAFC